MFPAGFLANLDTGSDEPEWLTHVILGKFQLAVPHTIQILIWRHFVQFSPVGNCHMGSCWNDSRVSWHEYHHKPHASQLEEAFWPLFFFDPISWLFNLGTSCSDLVSWILPGETAAANSQSKCCSSNWLLQGCYYTCEFLYTNLPCLACGHYWGKDFQLSVLFYLLQAMYTDNKLWYCSGQVDGDRPKAEVFTEIDKLLSELQEGETNKVGATIAVRSL